MLTVFDDFVNFFQRYETSEIIGRKGICIKISRPEGRLKSFIKTQTYSIVESSRQNL
jgi:hypothetical protein